MPRIRNATGTTRGRKQPAFAPLREEQSTVSARLLPTSALATQEGGTHYRELAIQPVQYCHANGIPFIEGCVIKYVTRWRSKDGVSDLRKARHFIDLLIELELELETRK